MESQGCGTTLESGDVTFALLRFVTLLALIDEGFTAGEHEIHHARQLVCSGGIRPRFVHATAQPSIEGASLKKHILSN